jgi:parvulin-like peptidyl-prolyl isomerase
MDKNYYILRLKERKEPYIPDFESIKDKVKETLIKERSKELAKVKLEDCLKKLQETYKTNPEQADFSKVAKEFNLKASSTDLFKYGSYIEGIGASDIFWVTVQNLKEGAFSEILEVPAGYYIIKLKSREQIDEKKFAEEKSEFAKKLLQQKKQEYFTQFLEDLKIKVQAY